MWIHIEMAPLDPDPDPYLEYGYGSRSRTVKIVSKNQKKSEISSLKSIHYFAEGLMVFTGAHESSISVF